jgi:cytochrome oxidase Cu insertion factor (SCO1/SenC/PrrC family)
MPAAEYPGDFIFRPRPRSVKVKPLRQRRRAGACRRSAAWLCLGLLAVAAAAGVGGATRIEQLPQQWRDDQGRERSLGELQGHRVFLSMAYTRCHRTCPTTVSQLQQVQRLLDQHGEQASIVIVGLDPENDDAASWRHYRAARKLERGNWYFLTGTLKQTRQLANELGFEFWTYDTHVMHDSRIVVFDSRGLLSAIVNPAAADWATLF